MTKEQAYELIEELYFIWYELGGANYANRRGSEILAMVDEAQP
jgi:hypothetical protein